MKLFRDDVYAKLANATPYNSIDDALRLIWRDKDLHFALREYARRNGIITHVPGRPGHGCIGLGTYVDKSIVLWELTGKKPKPPKPVYLKLCPDAAKVWTPIYFYYMAEHSSSGYDGDHFTYKMEEVIEVEEKEDGFYISHGMYKGRLAATGFFGPETGKQILHNLETALETILTEGKEQK